MMLSVSKSKNSTSLYAIKDVIENNKRTTKVVKRLGTIKELEGKLNGQNPMEWAKKYIKELNDKDREGNREFKKLKEMNFYKVKSEGYLPAYTRDDLTDDLHIAFGFRTDYQIASKKQMKNIFKARKK